VASKEYLVITIVNWEKYQADAKRYKNPEWFRLNINIVDHALWDVLNPTEFKFFVMLLALTMSNGHRNGTITTSDRSLARHLNSKSTTKPSQIRSVLGTLRGLGILEFQIVNARSLPDSCRLHYLTLHNITEQGSAPDLKMVGEGNSESDPEPEKRKLTDLKESVFKDIRRIQGKVGEQKDEV